MHRLANFINRKHDHRVLFGSFFEYLSPLWARQFQSLAHSGVVFGSVVHDPIRDFVVGPECWHRWSVGTAYSFVREAFVHNAIELDVGTAKTPPRVTVIPHGPYVYPAAKRTRSAVRSELGITEHTPLMLSFGHIRDGKNLDLVLQAMRAFPHVHLLVAGKEQSGGQKSARVYQALAEKLGIDARCHWRIGYIDDLEVSELFEASDLVLLTYSSTFRSASGVLNTVAQFRKPCLASGGKGNLSQSIEKYGLGIWIEPDLVEAISVGISRWLAGESPVADWLRYENENSWDANAQIVLQKLGVKK